MAEETGNEYVSVDLSKIEGGDKITDQDLDSSKDISRKLFFGKAVCVVTFVDAKKEAMKYSKPPYVCLALVVRLTISSVLEIEMPIYDESGEPLMKNGEPVLKIRKLSAEEQTTANLKFSNHIIKDLILLQHDLENENTGRRRLNIAQAFGLASKGMNSIPHSKWLEIRNKKIVIKTKREEFTPKGKTELVTLSKVDFAGYSPFNMAVDTGTTENFDDL